MADSFLPPVIVELGASDAGAIKAITGLSNALARIPEVAQPAADAFKVVLDAATQMGDGIATPMDVAKASIRSVASAMRALTKAATGMNESGSTAMKGVAASADQMATSVSASVGTAKASVAELGAEFKAIGGESAAAAGEVGAAAEESAAAAKASGDAAAASAEKSGLALEGTAGALNKYLMGLAAAGVGVFAAIKGATQFNAEITKLSTQANVSQDQMKSLGNGVLDLAGQVGFSPDSLAEALFHVESSFASTGITGAKAMEILKTAAEGAKLGGANLVDVQNALDAAVASGIPGVQNFSQAMGALNAIVGSGDMQMQDLANALGTGVLAVVKGYGLTLKDVGAALATFGDNNIRGAVAATDLRMAVQTLAVPVSTAKTYLKEFGMTTQTLADDMRKGGLKLALNDLMDRMRKAGVTAQEQGQVITEMFGKKAGAGLAVLMGQLGRFNSKYPELEKGASGFANAWQTAQQTLSVQFDQMKSGLEALGVKIGTALIPPLTKFLGWVRDGISWITQHKAAVQALAAIIGGMLVAALGAVAGALAAIEINPVILGITAVAAALIFAYEHFKTFRTVINDIGRFLAGTFKAAWDAAAAVIRWFSHTVMPYVKFAIYAVIMWFDQHKQTFVNAWNQVVHAVQSAVKWFDQNVLQWVKSRIAELESWWRQHSAQIQEVWDALWKVAKVAVQVWWDGYMKPTLTAIKSTWTVVWGVIKDTFKVAWDLIKGIVTTAMHFVENDISLVLDIITGKWGRVWGDMKRLVGQMLNDTVNTIKSVASGFGNLLYDAGRNIVQGLINGIRSMIGAAGSSISDVVSEIKNYLPWSPAKKGPLSGSGSPEVGGRNIGRQVATGLASSTPWISEAAEHMAGAASMSVGSNSWYGNASLAALAASGGALEGAAGGELQPIVVQVDGRTLFQIVQTHALRYGRRNPTTGLTYTVA